MSAYDPVRQRMIAAGMVCAETGRLTPAGLEYSGRIKADVSAATATDGDRPAVKWKTNRGKRK